MVRCLIRSGVLLSKKARLQLAAFSPRPLSVVGRDEGLPADEMKRRIVNSRILYRSRQRGYLELDLILGKWAEDNVPSLDDALLQGTAQLLDAESPDLWKWVTGQEEPPPTVAENPVFSAIRHYVSEKLLNYSPPDTRATPGLPWVRGWDDNRKPGGPQVGNQ
eukprot:TRINITY_DN10863_c0_g1_i2.p1 TRINITY_DN10863_c0_g1~~TRINITY_DN10863_c0_g1_i2.p1  ORF type:complete len:163 (+),score=23.34 TRINITY_DN10863_c0_g1_i2:106-594(+)